MLFCVAELLAIKKQTKFLQNFKIFKKFFDSCFDRGTLSASIFKIHLVNVLIFIVINNTLYIVIYSLFFTIIPPNFFIQIYNFFYFYLIVIVLFLMNFVKDVISASKKSLRNHKVSTLKD